MANLALLGLLAIIPGIYVLLAVIMFFAQRKILYPTYLIRGQETTTTEEPLILLSGKYRIRCATWMSPPEKARGVTVLILHANACANMDDFVWLFGLLNCHLVVPTYRGYGRSEGSPSQKGLIQDAQAALDHILNNPLMRDTRIVIFGWSLGGAVACHLVAQNPNVAKALITLNAWSSVPNLIRENIPIYKPFLFLLRDKWVNYEAFKKVGPDTSILIMNGRSDYVVPPNSYYLNQQSAVARPINQGTINRVMLLSGGHGDTHITASFAETLSQFLDETVPSLQPASESSSASSVHNSISSEPQHPQAALIKDT